MTAHRQRECAAWGRFKIRLPRRRLAVRPLAAPSLPSEAGCLTTPQQMFTIRSASGARGGYRNPAKEISEQHRRTGPPRDQAGGAAGAGVQILSLGRGDTRRRRAHAHDPKGAVANDGQIAPSEAVLRSRGVNIESPAVAPLVLTQISHANLRQNHHFCGDHAAGMASINRLTALLSTSPSRTRSMRRRKLRTRSRPKPAPSPCLESVSRPAGRRLEAGARRRPWTFVLAFRTRPATRPRSALR